MPAPLRPSSAITSPAWMSRSTSWRISESPSCTWRPCAETSTSPGVTSARGAGVGAANVRSRARRRASRTVKGGGFQPSRCPSRVTGGAPGYSASTNSGAAGAPINRASAITTAASAIGAARSSRCSATMMVVPRSAFSRGDGSEHVFGTLRVELARRFVEHEHRGSGHQCTGDRAALPFTARQRGGVAIAQVSDPERVHDFFHPAAHPGRVPAEVLESEGDVGLDPIHHELGFGILVDEADDVGEFTRRMVAGRTTGHRDRSPESAAATCAGPVRSRRAGACSSRIRRIRPRGECRPVPLRDRYRRARSVRRDTRTTRLRIRVRRSCARRCQIGGGRATATTGGRRTNGARSGSKASATTGSKRGHATGIGVPRERVVAGRRQNGERERAQRDAPPSGASRHLGGGAAGTCADERRANSATLPRRVRRFRLRRRSTRWSCRCR